MRILLIIVAVIGWLAAAGLGLMVGNENLFSENAEQAAKIIEQLGDSPEAAQLAGFRTSGMGALLVALLSTIGLVLTFIKKAGPQLIVAGLGSAVAILFIILSPSVDVGAHGGMGPRTQMMIIGIAGIVSLLAGVGAEKKRQSAG